ncbi:MAG: hypothetical protein K2X38_12780 [Gemmataceae bacterium]|nr:hypothetical protein [Gemmataceae bacterium]
MACRLVRAFVWEHVGFARQFGEFCRRHGISAHRSNEAEVLRMLPQAWNSDGGVLFELSMRAVEIGAVLHAGSQPSLEYVLGVGEWPCFVFTRRDGDEGSLDQAYAPLLAIVPRSAEPESFDSPKRPRAESRPFLGKFIPSDERPLLPHLLQSGVR